MGLLGGAPVLGGGLFRLFRLFSRAGTPAYLSKYLYY